MKSRQHQEEDALSQSHARVEAVRPQGQGVVAARAPFGLLRGETAARQLIELQRLAGNRAVSEVVQRSTGKACCSSCAGGRACESESSTEGNAAAVVARIPESCSLALAAPTPSLASFMVPEAVHSSVQRQGGAAAGSAAAAPAACNVFGDLSGFAAKSLGANAFAARTGFTLSWSGSTASAVFAAGNSWVNRYFVPVGGARTGATAKSVKDCKTAFKKASTAWYEVTPGATCPAAAANQATHRANNAGECETVIGANKDAEDAADAGGRLLEHEQYHLKLACALADKATAAVSAGTSLANAKKQLKTAVPRETNAYDAASAHGCNAAGQSTWQSNIDSGNLTFP